jgi:hypothetical protein
MAARQVLYPRFAQALPFVRAALLWRARVPFRTPQRMRPHRASLRRRPTLRHRRMAQGRRQYMRPVAITDFGALILATTETMHRCLREQREPHFCKRSFLAENHPSVTHHFLPIAENVS